MASSFSKKEEDSWMNQRLRLEDIFKVIDLISDDYSEYKSNVHTILLKYVDDDIREVSST
jgi:hypothetical protein